MSESKKAPMSARERSALATKRAKKHPWHVWHENGFQEAVDPMKRFWKFGTQK
jgi:hypothetical protein